MPPLNGTSGQTEWPNLDQIKVLYDFDGPKIFTCNDAAGKKHLAYLFAVDRQGMHYLVVPFSDSVELLLTFGFESLRKVLDVGGAWILDVSNDWQVGQARRVDAAELHRTVALPQPGVLLYAHLRPPVIQMTLSAGSNVSTQTSLSATPAMQWLRSPELVHA